MKCQWKWCCEEAVVHLFKHFDEPTYVIVPPQGRQLKPRKRRIWTQSLMVCENCQPQAQLEYRWLSFVPPHRYQAECRLGAL